MKLSDKFRTLGVRANADTPLDAKTAKKFGAEAVSYTHLTLPTSDLV